MSADNWAKCPRCALKHADIEKSYGKVSAKEYAKLLADKAVEDDTSYPLREDYDLGMSKDGIFFVSYSCECQKCKFSFTFKKQEQVRLT